MLKSTLLPLLALLPMGILAVDRIQVNYYSDYNCKDYIGTQYISDSDCTGNIWGTNSLLLVCNENGEQITFGNGGCGGDKDFTAVPCGGCDYVESASGICQQLNGDIYGRLTDTDCDAD